MSTYAELAANRERTSRKAAQDRHDAARHREWDLSAQDRHVKSERCRFSVVGEGSLTAQENYRIGYEHTFASSGPSRPSKQPHGVVKEASNR